MPQSMTIKHAVRTMHCAPHSKVCVLRRTQKCAPHMAGDCHAGLSLVVLINLIATARAANDKRSCSRSPSSAWKKRKSNSQDIVIDGKNYYHPFPSSKKASCVWKAFWLDSDLDYQEVVHKMSTEIRRWKYKTSFWKIEAGNNKWSNAKTHSETSSWA